MIFRLGILELNERFNEKWYLVWVYLNLMIDLMKNDNDRFEWKMIFRMGIQEALTTLECLTGMLNERKR